MRDDGLLRQRARMTPERSPVATRCRRSCDTRTNTPRFASYATGRPLRATHCRGDLMLEQSGMGERAGQSPDAALFVGRVQEPALGLGGEPTQRR